MNGCSSVTERAAGLLPTMRGSTTSYGIVGHPVAIVLRPAAHVRVESALAEVQVGNVLVVVIRHEVVRLDVGLIKAALVQSENATCTPRYLSMSAARPSNTACKYKTMNRAIAHSSLNMGLWSYHVVFGTYHVWSPRSLVSGWRLSNGW